MTSVLTPSKPPVAWLAVNAVGHRYLRFKPPAVAVDPEPSPLCFDRDRRALWEALYRIQTHALMAAANPEGAEGHCLEITKIAEKALVADASGYQVGP